jgi:hypothetical protein
MGWQSAVAVLFQAGNRVVINPSGIFIYNGAPALGNLIGYWTETSGTDPYGNVFIEALSIGSPTGGSPQVQIIPSAGGPGSPAAVQFTLSPLSFFSNQPNMQAASASNSGQFTISGPALAQTGFRDFVEDVYYAFQGTTAAKKNVNYIDTNGNVIPYEQVTYSGVSLGAVKQVAGVHPGTGLSNTNTAVQEQWQTLNLINGWAGSGGIGGVRYQMTPLLNGEAIFIEGDVVNAGGAPANSIIGTMGSGYTPSQNRNVPAGWNHPLANNSPTAPWIFIDTSGDIQVTGLQVGTAEVFFQCFVPMT